PGEAEIAGHALGTRGALVSLSALRPRRTGASLRPLRRDLAPRERALVVPALRSGRVDDAQRTGRLHVAAPDHPPPGMVAKAAPPPPTRAARPTATTVRRRGRASLSASVFISSAPFEPVTVSCSRTGR